MAVWYSSKASMTWTDVRLVSYTSLTLSPLKPYSVFKVFRICLKLSISKTVCVVLIRNKTSMMSSPCGSYEL